jgi:hypothetical protein
MSPQNYEIRRQEIDLSTQKILYVPEGFAGLSGELTMGQIFNGASDNDREQVSILQEFGYQVQIVKPKTLDSLDWSNPLTLGFAIDSMPFAQNPAEYYRQDKIRAERAGLRVIPAVSNWKDVLNSSEIFLAKSRSSNRGENKFLLDTPRAKQNFFLWQLIGRNLFDLPYFAGKENKAYTLEDAQLQIESARQALLANERHPLFNEDPDSDENAISLFYELEKFIETPTPHYTSAKVLVDFNGGIHYTHFFYSHATKSEEHQPYIFDKSVFLPQRYVENPWHTYHNRHSAYAQHPNSPLYYPYRNIVSIPSVASRIDFDGPVRGKFSRKMLEAHHINPDHPQLPDDILGLVQKLAFVNRDRAPFMTYDFIFSDTEKVWYFLEGNAGPQLDRKYAGVPLTATDEEALNAMLRKVLSS